MFSRSAFLATLLAFGSAASPVYAQDLKDKGTYRPFPLPPDPKDPPLLDGRPSPGPGVHPTIPPETVPVIGAGNSNSGSPALSTFGKQKALLTDAKTSLDAALRGIAVDRYNFYPGLVKDFIVDTVVNLTPVLGEADDFREIHSAAREGIEAFLKGDDARAIEKLREVALHTTKLGLEVGADVLLKLEAVGLIATGADEVVTIGELGIRLKNQFDIEGFDQALKQRLGRINAELRRIDALLSGGSASAEPICGALWVADACGPGFQLGSISMISGGQGEELAKASAAMGAVSASEEAYQQAQEAAEKRAAEQTAAALAAGDAEPVSTGWSKFLDFMNIASQATGYVSTIVANSARNRSSAVGAPAGTSDAALIKNCDDQYRSQVNLTGIWQGLEIKADAQWKAQALANFNSCKALARNMAGLARDVNSKK